LALSASVKLAVVVSSLAASPSVYDRG